MYELEKTLKVQNICKNEIKTKQDQMLVLKILCILYLIVKEAKRKKKFQCLTTLKGELGRIFKICLVK